MNKDAKFISIEGGEGAGKSTAIKTIQSYLNQQSIAHIVTREPGGTPLAEKIRSLLLDKSDEILLPESELLLFFASRYQHSQHVIKPALKKGLWVISDRFVDASFAYQGAGRGIEESRITYLKEWLLRDLSPDHTLLLDAPPAVGLDRIKARGELDRIEVEKMDFFNRVREYYLNLAAKESERFHIIDTSGSLSDVEENTRLWLEGICERC
ncbi:MAG: tmk [Gammaproteobacteria bacterium]|nr:tmk [Gammaproteobacteria bacterium]